MRRDDRDDGGRDRAQLILVSALVLATTLVALSLVVNSVIYTENLATRRNVDTGQALDFREATEAGATEGLVAANFGAADATFLQRKATFRDAVAGWRTSSSRYFAREGLEVDVTAASFVEGTRVSQTDTGPFIPANEDVIFSNNELDLLGLGGEETWLAADEVGVRRLRLDVERDDRLYESSQDIVSTLLDTVYDGNEPYALQITDANGDSWQVYVYEDTSTSPGQVGIGVYDLQADDWVGSEQCLASGDEVAIDVTGGTLTGDGGTQTCDALSFWDDTEGPYDLYHVNGNSVTGTYSFVTDRPEDEFRQAVEDRNNGNLYDDITDLLGGLFTGSFDDSDTYAETDGSTVYTTPAIYATEVGVRYETNALVYDSVVRLAPGEPGESAGATAAGGGGGGGSDTNAAPDAQFDATSTTVETGEDVSFDATASTDADGSIASYEWSYGDGEVDTGSTTTHSFDTTGSYDVTLTVTDDDGGTDSRTRTVDVVSGTAQAPTIDDLVVTDGSSPGSKNNKGDISFTADWEVSDGDGNLAQVRVELVGKPDSPGNGGLSDTASATVSGGSSDSALTVGGENVNKGCGEPYDVVVTVEDADGQAATTTERVTASC